MPTKRITRALRLDGNNSRQTQKQSDSASLIDFLNAVQVNDVCFLPVAYQKSLGSIGIGLSGTIQQSTADISTVLAFKEGVPSKHPHDTEQEQDWYSLVTEITVLQHPQIRENHHIVNLLGVTFRVESVQDKEKRAFPLLVTSKVNHGDLASFLLEKEGEHLTPNLRLQLLAEVAEATQLLRSSGIAHGDIKPQNFLMEEFEHQLNCRLIDFGSSSIQGQKRLPTKSAPWNSPELDYAQELTTDALILSDTYSFGLLCVHIILPVNDLAKANILFLRCPEQTDSQWAEYLSAMVGKKRKDSGDTLAIDILKAIDESHIPTTQKLLIQEIVNKTIHPRPDRRNFPWDEMLPYIEKFLSDGFNIEPRSEAAPPPLAFNTLTLPHTEHKTFDLAALFGELDDTDYVLRQNIAHDMMFKASSVSCLLCRQEYSFRVALCYVVGFGVVKDEHSSRDWLAKSNKGQEDILKVVELLGADYKMTGHLPKKILEALGIGVVVSTDRTEEYQISGRLLEAQEALQNEISARQNAFGPKHRSLAKLMMDMTMVLKARNRPKEAEEIQENVVNILTESFGDRHPSVLMAKVHLASILADEGWLQKAVDLQDHVRPILVEVLGPEHPETLTALQILATTLVRQGKYKEAENILREVVTARHKILTKTHPQTIKAEISLVAVLRAQGLLNNASELMSNIDEKIQNTSRDDQLTQASLFTSQTELYKELGLLDKAAEKSAAALKVIEQLGLAKDDPLRLTALEGMASIYSASWKLKEQEDILREVLQINSSLDRNNHWLLSIKAHLAKNLLNQNLLDDASAIAEDVLDTLKTSAEVYTENYLACTDVLATSLFRQGKKEQAEEISRHLLFSCEKELGESHPFTLEATHYLGDFYSDCGAFDKAEELCIPVLKRFRELQQLGKNAVQLAALIAAAKREQGKYDDAESLCNEIITWCKEAFGEGHTQTLQAYDILGRTYLMRDKRSDAENLYTTKLEKQSQGTPIEIYVKNNMAELRRQQGQFQAAEELMLEVLEIAETRHGKLHPISLTMAGNLLGALLERPLTVELEETALGNIMAKREIFGVTHPSTIKTMTDLAYAYGENGRFEDAHKLYKDVEDAGGLETFEKSNPSRYAIFCGKLGDLYFRQGRFEEGQKLEERALSIRKQIYGGSHRATLVSMANLAATLHAQKKYAEAEVYLRDIITVREEAVQTDPHSVFLLLKSKSSLAANLFFQDKLEESAELYRDILETSQFIGIDAAIMDIWKVDYGKVLEKLPQQEIPKR